MSADQSNYKRYIWLTRLLFPQQESCLTLAFSCGGRSASKLKVKGYLREMLSRRQLQGFVGPPIDGSTLICITIIFDELLKQLS
jgi:hypothetical protein